MTTTAVPQHLSALARANEVRFARARVKRALKAGRITLAQALDRDAVQSMRVMDLLACQHRWGPARARRALRVAGVSQSFTVGKITARQRRVLTLIVEGHAEVDAA